MPITCLDRHCPKCQGLARAEWLEARQAEMLPVPYFHVVFTVPASVADIAFHNKTVVYAILFRAAAATLRSVAADPRYLGAEVGAIAVLHSWGHDLAEKCEPVLGRAAPPLEIGEDTLMNLGARRASRGLLKKPS